MASLSNGRAKQQLRHAEADKRWTRGDSGCDFVATKQPRDATFEGKGAWRETFARKRRVLKPDRVSQACSFFLNSRHTQRSVTICSRNEYPYSTQPTSHMCTDAKPYAENLRVSECGRVPFLNLQFSCYRVSATAQIEILLQRQRGQAKAAG